MLKTILKTTAAAAIIIIPGSLGVLAVGWVCKKVYDKFSKKSSVPPAIWLCSNGDLWLSIKVPVPEDAVEYWNVRDITISPSKFIQFEKECRTLGVEESSIEIIRKAFYPKGEHSVSVH